jgi:FkbM family methyltransferase
MSLIVTISGHTFLPRSIRKDGTVVDLGANRGYFARQIISRYGAIRYFAVEANPYLAASLAQEVPAIRVRHAAVTDQNTMITLNLSRNCEQSSIVESVAGEGASQVSVPGRTLDAILRENEIDEIDLLKVDIEGAEVGVFSAVSDDTLAKISQITIEFHDFLGAYSPEAVLLMVERFRQCGFCGVRFSRSNMNWLFFNPGRCGVGTLAMLYIKHVLPYVRWFRLAIGLDRDGSIP